MALKENDFIEIEYTGKTKDEGIIFDTTNETVAKEQEIHNPQMNYGSVIVCLGKGQLIKGLENQLIGKDIGKFNFDIAPEDGFGKKSAKLIQLVPTSKFKKEKIMPQPGLQVNIDGQIGIIKTVSGGRTLVDFNHPLSGKPLIYDLEVKRIVTDDKEKLSSLLEMQLGMKDLKIEIKDKNAVAFVENEIPEEFTKMIEEDVKKFIGLKELKFKKKEKKTDNPKEEKASSIEKKAEEVKKQDSENKKEDNLMSSKTEQ